jgi:hypothetical protein
VRRRLDEVFEEAVEQGTVSVNLAALLHAKLRREHKPKRVTPHKALAFATAPAFVEGLSTQPGIAARCLEFTIYTARLLVVEAEFAQVLRQAARAGNTLSATIRSASDSGNFRTITRNEPITATGAHICIIGHITANELRAELTATDSANGFANRFLFMCARRSKALPFGGGPINPDVQEGFARRIGRAVEGARRLGAVGWHPRRARRGARLTPA